MAKAWCAVAWIGRIACINIIKIQVRSVGVTLRNLNNRTLQRLIKIKTILTVISKVHFILRVSRGRILIVVVVRCLLSFFILKASQEDHNNCNEQAHHYYHHLEKVPIYS